MSKRYFLCLVIWYSVNAWQTRNIRQHNYKKMAETEDKKLFIDGYSYARSRAADCQRVRQGECTARAVTNDPRPDEDIIVYRGPAECTHTHPPNSEEANCPNVDTNEEKSSRTTRWRFRSSEPAVATWGLKKINEEGGPKKSSYKPQDIEWITGSTAAISWQIGSQYGTSNE